MSRRALTAQQPLASLLPLIESLPALADSLEAQTPELAARLARFYGAIVERIVPYMDAEDATIYLKLERLTQDRDSMAPMRHQHEELRAQIAELGSLVGVPLTPKVRMGLRRILYHLYAELKIHLGEESVWHRAWDNDGSPDPASAVTATNPEAQIG